MPTVDSLRFHVLNVGQGACNYIEMLDASGTVLYNILIDLGTVNRKSLSQKNIDWLNEQIKDRDNPRISVVILTHGDIDHYSLIMDLAKGLGDPDQRRIGMVRYGNPSWRYNARSKERIAWLATYCNNVGGYTGTWSGFDKTDKKWTPMWVTPDPFDPNPVKVELIIVNVPHPTKGNLEEATPEDSPDGEIVNGESLVSAITWRGRWFVATGDATGGTFKAILTRLGTEGAGTIPVATMLTMPHHGARKTAYDLKAAGNDIGDEAYKNVEKFVSLFKPASLTVSAGMYGGFFHPFMDVMEQFGKHLNSEQLWADPKTGDKKTHFLNAYFLKATTADGAEAGPAVLGWATTQTAANIYSTRYFARILYNVADRRPKAKVVDTNSPPVKPPPTTGNKNNKRKRDDDEEFYRRYIYPPGPAALLVADDTKQVVDVPEYHNWTFTVDNQAVVTLTPTPDTASPAQAARRFVRHAVARADVPASHVLARDQRALAPPAAATRFVATMRPSSVERRTPAVSRLRTLRAIP